MIRSILRGSLVMALVAVLASSATAEKEGRKKRRQKEDPAVAMAERKIKQWEEKIELTDEQKTQIREIAAVEFPKIAAANAASDAILTDEQRAAKKAAWKQSGAEGIEAKERKAYVMERVNLTDEQKAKLVDTDAALKATQKEINEKLTGVLTDEQKTLVTPVKKGKGKKMKKEAVAG